MVLESIISPFKAEKRPWELFFVGIAYTSIAILLSLWVFNQYASLVMVFLTVMAAIPLVFSTIKWEEKKDTVMEEETQLLKEHSKALSFLVFLFLGMTLTFTAWYVFLPPEMAQNLFSIQSQTISNINNQVTGNTPQQLKIFTIILVNNFKVLTFSILFSLLYGMGAIFILTWNASVIGTAIGNFIRVNLTTSNYFHITSLGIFRYALHGIPEIISYFIAGLAGGIISIAIIRHDFGTKTFERILLDSADLLLISILILIVAALIEVFITPVLF